MYQRCDTRAKCHFACQMCCFFDIPVAIIMMIMLPKNTQTNLEQILRFYSIWLSYINTPCSKYVSVQITIRNLSLVYNAIVCTSLSLLIIIIQLKLLFFLCPFRSGREKNQNTPSCGAHMALKNQSYYVQNLLVKYSQAPSLASLKSTFPGGKDGCVMA